MLRFPIKKMMRCCLMAGSNLRMRSADMCVCVCTGSLLTFFYSAETKLACARMHIFFGRVVVDPHREDVWVCV